MQTHQRFLRIDNLVSNGYEDILYLNLGEIQLFNGPNQLTGLSSLATGSVRSDLPISNCFDDNVNSFHSSADYDRNPWLQIDVTGLVFDKVIIYNRQDYGSFRIVGARIAIITSTGLVTWQSTFDTDSLEYTFYTIPMPSAEPTSPMPSESPSPYPTNPTSEPTGNVMYSIIVDVLR